MQLTTMNLTFVVPAYNEARYIGELPRVYFKTLRVSIMR
jgi:hypothetical protein